MDQGAGDRPLDVFHHPYAYAALYQIEAELEDDVAANGDGAED